MFPFTSACRSEVKLRVSFSYLPYHCRFFRSEVLDNDILVLCTPCSESRLARNRWLYACTMLHAQCGDLQVNIRWSVI